MLFFWADKIAGGRGLPVLCLFMMLCKHATSHTATEPSFYSSSNHDRMLYDQPRPRPKRRGDIPPKAKEPISSSRDINYGTEGHPYERVSRLREEKEESARRQKQRSLDEENGNNHHDQDILRILQNDELFQPLRIHFDTTDLDRWSVQSTETAQRVEYLRSYVLPRMARTWTSALSVIPVVGNLKIDYNMCPFGDPATSPSFQERGVGNTDLVIYVTANSDFCSQRGTKVLASAFSCFWDQFERPIAGTIDFCLNAIELEDDHPVVTGMNQADGQPAASRSTGMSPKSDTALQLAVSTAVHEIAHVLGITSSDMLFYYDSKTGLPRTPEPQEKEVTCMTGQRKRMWVPDETTLREKYSRGVRYFEVTLPTVRQVARNQFDCQRLTGAPLENQPTNEDCFGSHFEERYFFTESLSAILGGVPELLSSLTLGLLHDSGWYKPDYSVAMVSPFGHGAGCEFVEESCIVDGKIPSYSSGSFCNTEYKVEQGNFQGRFGCDPTHTSMAICDLVDYATLSSAYTPPPTEFQYFPGMPNRGALTGRVDYCPTFSIDAVSCQEVPGRLEEFLIPQLEYFATAAESSEENSRCFNTDQARPICLEAECDSVNQVLNVQVAGRDLICDSDGQTHLIPGTNVTFECPNIKFMCPDLACRANCAGHGICDFSSTAPVCKCFDKDDSTAGCFNSFSSVPPEIAWNDQMNEPLSSSSRVVTSKHHGLLMPLLLAAIWLI